MQFALDADEPLAAGVDGVAAQVDADPAPAESFGDGEGRAGTAEEIGYQTALIGRCLNYQFQKSFGFLCIVSNALIR